MKIVLFCLATVALASCGKGCCMSQCHTMLVLCGNTTEQDARTKCYETANKCPDACREECPNGR